MGEQRDCGSHTVTAEEIIDFGRQYDPQPMHVDPDIADSSPLGGLVASGWQTCALSMRLFVASHLEEFAVIGALGVSDLRWYEPVRPDDTLRVYSTVERTDEWDEDGGVVDFHIETVVNGTTVAERVDEVLLARR